MIMVCVVGFSEPIRSMISAKGISMINQDGGIPLPEGIVAVEYIESTDSSQYIDIGYVVTSVETVCSVSYMRTNGNGYTFAGFGNYGNGLNLLLYSGNGCVVSYGNKTYNVWDGNLGGVNEILNVTIGNEVAISKNINRDYSITKELDYYDFSRNTKSFWIFKSNGANFDTPLGVRFIGATIKIGENEICNVIPCRFINNDGHNVGCVYDLVREELFTNSGVGEFIIGPDKEIK